MNMILLGLILLWSVHLVSSSKIEDHFFRDYYGLVPTDAIPGGKTEDGGMTYIGQFPVLNYFEDLRIDLLTATIVKGELRAYGPYNNRTVYSDDVNVKILCAKYPTEYKWYSPTQSYPPKCRYVTVGYEGTDLFVGKATVGRQEVLGKIFSNSTNRLIIPFNGGESYPSSYTVLTYCSS
ncbi:hypothetical protein PPYR_12616 [Photinus pyralis]|uniref:Uncharacterized protein n=1 Tax=Photinus pyralis TaxID=7054 RepID=A0A1Y1LK61_PHOPY|nr:uncharacterized protein LOC116179640 isoform X2 [Photinus pyralis]KAB0792996.1 hypothetical protein PPYR_12616 [Photinus pyralis]